MDPETDIETRTDADRPRRASRAPWDPPPRPTRPGDAHKRCSDGDPDEPAVLGGFYDDPGRGAD